MIIEFMTPFSCENFTYIDFQGGLWVTLTFGFSYSQSVPWNFLFFIYINLENMKTLHISYIIDLHGKYISSFNSLNEKKIPNYLT